MPFETKQDFSRTYLLLQKMSEFEPSHIYNVHFPLMTSVAQFTHKCFATLCAQVALIGVAGLLVLVQSLSRGKPLLTLITLHTLDLTVSSSLVLQGLGPTYESLATNTALVRPLVVSAGSSATSNGWRRLC